MSEHKKRKLNNDIVKDDIVEDSIIENSTIPNYAINDNVAISVTNSIPILGERINDVIIPNHWTIISGTYSHTGFNFQTMSTAETFENKMSDE